MTRLNENETPSIEAGQRPDDRPRPPLFKRPRAVTVLLVLAIGAAVAALVFWLYARQYESTDDAFIEGHVIAVSPKVSAIVQRVYIDDNSRVKKGDLLVELDARDYAAALAQAQGNEASAQGKLREAQAQVSISHAEIDQAQAGLQVAQANAQNAQSDLDRFLSLDAQARSKQQLDNATAAQRSTAAQVEDAKAKIAAAQAQLVDAQMAVLTAEGNLQAAQAALQQARNNFGYCKIYAESDGVIARKDVEPGAYVQVDQPMFSIVQYDVWVVANFKETQLADIVPGQPADISVDAYPGRHITGKVQSIQNGTGSRFTLLPPENATGNYVKIIQRVPVKIQLDANQNDDPDHLLSPGMSVEPSVKVR
jgi:membrane fusion protein (multidrug efflux system)